MTPEQYLVYDKEISREITDLRKRLWAYRAEADKANPPDRTRQATAEDIVCGAIIWHEGDPHDGGDYWHVVDEVLRPSDSYKAYCADDGCRYGLSNAYVEETK